MATYLVQGLSLVEQKELLWLVNDGMELLWLHQICIVHRVVSHWL